MSHPYYQPQGHEIDLFQTAWRARRPVLLKGPTGCGKTRLVEHMASRLNLPLITVACHDELSAADLVGRHLIDANGTWWQDGPLTRAVRSGGICYLDEAVEARKDTTVIIHSLTDDRRCLYLERTSETLHAAASFMLVISYNPGYQQGIKGLKPSTRQRFVALQLDVPPPEIECQIIHQETQLDPELCTRLVRLGQALRRNASHELEEGPGTRILVAAAALIQQGCPVHQACEAAVLQSLTDNNEVLVSLRPVMQAIMGRMET